MTGLNPRTAAPWSSAQWLNAGEGSAPLLVFVHGMQDSWDSWRPLVGRLNPAWRAVALDLPWRAGGDHRWARERSARDWLIGALADLGEPVDALIGHSLGATALLGALAADAAPVVRAAVLITPYYQPPEQDVTWTLFNEARQHFTDIVGAALRVRLGQRLPAVEPDIREAMVANVVKGIGPLGFLALFEEFTASGDLPLTRVAPPVLVLSSRTDPGLANGRAAALAGRVPRLRLVLRDNYHHHCHLDQASDVAADIREFLGSG